MERGSITRWLLLGLAVFLFFQFGLPLMTGTSAGDRQPLDVQDALAPAPEARSAEELCALAGPRFEAVLSTRGGSLRHVYLKDPKYIVTEPESARVGQPIDLVTTSREERSPLRTDLHLVAPIAGELAQQVGFDDLDWTLAAKDERSCTFAYTDDRAPDGAARKPTVALTKTVALTGAPFELKVSLDVKNLADAPRAHRLAIEQTSYRTKKETESQLGSVSQHMTEVVAATDKGVERLLDDQFDPKAFEQPEFTAERWRRSPGEARWAATSSTYFTAAIVHAAADAAPVGETQIEEIWCWPGSRGSSPQCAQEFDDAHKKDDPNFGHVYRSRLAYPVRELQPGETARYEVLSFTGPKERALLAAVGGHDLSEIIDLGWFSYIGKALISYVYVLYGLVGSWGWAICLLTITVKVLLFPLSIAQIKSSVAMRRLKPEMDAINEKYKDDMTQRGLATQELWRKHNVSSPVVGCIPMLLQMPVWFALYQALQTAVELYHQPFGPFIPDLSAPGRYFIIPIVLGASSFLQQKLMPPQGDPQQQKMMLYMMPGVFTVMMLFLPAGLGVYMLTNTWLGIGQQVLVERYLRSRTQGPSGPAEITVREKKTTKSGDEKAPPSLGKGKARVHG
jgi:YidC/Oxa1 family membrane protein insertase